ncbi:hypothetical protein EJB05_28640, partial [Eragrostis curvula]
MAPRRKKSKKPPATSSAIDNLPDAVLEHILGLLPVHEAVQTCVLARRWRDLWKFTTRLHITRSHPCDIEQTPVKNIREFVDHVLLIRGSSPIDVCDICLLDLKDEDMASMNHWIRHLKLFDLWFNDNFVDLSSCPALEELEIDGCYLASVDGISSESLKRLSIGCSCRLGQSFRNRIYVPNLISLQLDLDFDGAPVLEKMPSLAIQRLTLAYYQTLGIATMNTVKVAMRLRVTTKVVCFCKVFTHFSTCPVYFSKGHEKCPVFSNLKILLLNEYWCVPTDLLTRILEHSPVLEKLTLELFCKGTKSRIEMKGRPDLKKQSSTISERLKLVEVKCDLVDEKVMNVLHFMIKFNIDSFTADLNLKTEIRKKYGFSIY